MKNNGLSKRFNRANSKATKQVIYPKRINSIYPRPVIAKGNNILSLKESTDKLNVPQSLSSSQKELSSKLSHKKNTIKLNIDIKESPIDDSYIINKEREQKRLEELEAELTKLNEEEKGLKTVQASIELKNISYIRDLEKNDNFICMKSNLLNKVKRDNLNLKERLEQLNKEIEEMNNCSVSIESSENNNQANSNIEDIFLRLMANYEAHKEEEEEEYTPLSYETAQKIPIHRYDNSTNETEKCDLCDFELCKNDVIMEIPSCKHIFHKECLLRFCERNNFCPSCKEEIDID